MNLLCIVDENLLSGSGQNVYIYTESVGHASKVTAVMLPQYMFYIASVVVRATTWHLDRNSSSGQLKNNIKLVYFIHRVWLGFHDNAL